LIWARASRIDTDRTGLRLRGENIVIDRRYRGPLQSANGGYAAGRLAAFVGGPAEVTLRLPPPLERPLAVAEQDGRVVLLDGDAIVAEARPETPALEPPRVTPAEAEAAAARHVRSQAESFSECFSCGDRPKDGLCIHVGPVTGREEIKAAPWTAHDVSADVVWAAIDCAGAYAVGGPGRGEVVLGRMTAEIRRLPAEDEPCVVVAWPLGEEGRKLHAGTALLAADGDVLAVARQTWIEPK
jgi:hypothetical protein